MLVTHEAQWVYVNSGQQFIHKIMNYDSSAMSLYIRLINISENEKNLEYFLLLPIH